MRLGAEHIPGDIGGFRRIGLSRWIAHWQTAGWWPRRVDRGWWKLSFSCIRLPRRRVSLVA